MANYQEPFFTRGPSPAARLTFFSLLAIVTMIADHRFGALGWLRLGVSVAINPVERVISLPGAAWRDFSQYFATQSKLVAENKALTEQVLSLSAAGQKAALLLAEASSVDVLQTAADRFDPKGLIAEVIRDARNPYARKIVVGKGSVHGVVPGLAVIDGEGVVGQVTAVGLLTAEVTLITEKDQSVPVIVVRNGLRAIAVGNGRDGTLDIPFIPLGADIQSGDTLVTSGIDGTYPPGLAMGKLMVVDKNPASPFAKVTVQPTSAPDRHRFVMVLLQHPETGFPKADTPTDERRTPTPTGHHREPRRAQR